MQAQVNQVSRDKQRTQNKKPPGQAPQALRPRNHTQHIFLHHFPILNPFIGPDDFTSDITLNMSMFLHLYGHYPNSVESTTLSPKDYLTGSQPTPSFLLGFLMLAQTSQSINQAVARVIRSKDKYSVTLIPLQASV